MLTTDSVFFVPKITLVSFLKNYEVNPYSEQSLYNAESSTHESLLIRFVYYNKQYYRWIEILNNFFSSDQVFKDW